jgi:hypothetical protein
VLILEVGEGGGAQVQARGNALAQLPALRFQVLFQPARNTRQCSVQTTALGRHLVEKN